MMKKKFTFLLYSLLFSITAICAQTEHQIPQMEYVDVCEKPTVCKKLSRLIMGTDHLGKIPNEKTLEVLNEAAKLGINVFDTAPIYTDGIEMRLGDWIKSQKRSDLFVITKGGFPRDLGPGTYSSRLQGTKKQIIDNILEEITGSSQRLNNAITIYLMHRDDADFIDYKKTARPQTPVKTILEVLSDPLIKNKYSMLGLSNWKTSRVNASQKLAKNTPNLVRPFFNSPYFSLLEMNSQTIHSGGVQVKHKEMMRSNFQNGVKIMSYSPLGGFSIFSKDWNTAKQNALDLKNKKDRYWRNVYDSIFTEANEKRYKRAIKFTEKFNKKYKTHYTLDQMANAYVLAHKRTDFIIIGPRTIEQLRRTVEALKLSKLLTEKDLNYLYQN